MPITLYTSQKHQKYLKCVWKDTSYKFTCFPNGPACCPRKFTKLLKPVFSTLREKGHVSSPYIDVSILIGSRYEESANNVIDTIRLLDSLGFVVLYILTRQYLYPPRSLCSWGFYLIQSL